MEMDQLTFISCVIDSLIWPIVVIIAIILLRKPVTELLYSITKIKYRDFEVEAGFTHLSKQTDKHFKPNDGNAEIDKLKDRIYSLINVAPKSAVIESWRIVEQKLLDLSRKNKIEIDKNLTKHPLELCDLLTSKKILTESQSSMIGQMRRLRNEVVHYTPKVITAEDAVTFWDSASRLILSFES